MQSYVKVWNIILTTSIFFPLIMILGCLCDTLSGWQFNQKMEQKFKLISVQPLELYYLLNCTGL
jgi:hypothetical protein